VKELDVEEGPSLQPDARSGDGYCFDPSPSLGSWRCCQMKGLCPKPWSKRSWSDKGEEFGLIPRYCRSSGYWVGRTRDRQGEVVGRCFLVGCPWLHSRL